MKSKAVSEGSGAAIQFSAKDLDKVLKVTESMVKRADAQSESTKGQKHTIKTIDRSSTTSNYRIDRSSDVEKGRWGSNLRFFDLERRSMR